MKNGAGPLVEKLRKEAARAVANSARVANKFARASMSTAQWMASDAYAKAKLLNEASKKVLEKAEDFANDVKEFGEAMAKELAKMAN